VKGKVEGKELLLVRSYMYFVLGERLPGRSTFSKKRIKKRRVRQKVQAEMYVSTVHFFYVCIGSVHLLLQDESNRAAGRN
jgi:hypothetical protein